MPKANIAQVETIAELSLSSAHNVLGHARNPIWNGLAIEQFRFNEINPPRFKPFCYSLILAVPALSSGSGKKVALPKEINKTGNICFFPTREAKRICLHQQQEAVVLSLSPEILRRAASESSKSPDIELKERHQFHDEQIEHIVMALKAEAENGYLSGRFYGEWLCMALSVHLVDKYSTAAPKCPEYKGGIAPRTLRRVIDYIRENLSEDVRLGELARVSGLSEHRFAHNFKQATGLSPHQFLIRERIERAKQMLCESDLTVMEIATAVGCASASRFTLLFRRATGMTPSAYRIASRL